MSDLGLLADTAYNAALFCVASGLSRTETYTELTEAYPSLGQGYIREAMQDAYRDALRSGIQSDDIDGSWK